MLFWRRMENTRWTPWMGWPALNLRCPFMPFCCTVHTCVRISLHAQQSTAQQLSQSTTLSYVVPRIRCNALNKGHGGGGLVWQQYCVDLSPHGCPWVPKWLPKYAPWSAMGCIKWDGKVWGSPYKATQCMNVYGGLTHSLKAGAHKQMPFPMRGFLTRPWSLRTRHLCMCKL